MSNSPTSWRCCRLALCILIVLVLVAGTGSVYGETRTPDYAWPANSEAEMVAWTVIALVQRSGPRRRSESESGRSWKDEYEAYCDSNRGSRGDDDVCGPHASAGPRGREGTVGNAELGGADRVEIRAHGFDVIVLATAGDTTRITLSGTSGEYELHHTLRDGILEAWVVGPSMSLTVAPEGTVRVEVPADSSVAVRTADSTIESSSGDVELDVVNKLDQLSFRLESSFGRLLAGRTEGRRELNLIGPGPAIVGDATAGSQHYY